MSVDATEAEEPEDEEGWETVQRGGRLRSRQSPSQKSLENLSEVGTGGKKLLARSLSVPDSSAPPKDRRGQPGAGGQRGTRSEGTNMHAISKQHLPEPRERLDSKGSEKENIPTRAQRSGGAAESRDPQVERVKRDIFGSKGKVVAWGNAPARPGPPPAGKAAGGEEQAPGEEAKKEAETSEGKSSDDENYASQLSDVSLLFFFMYTFLYGYCW